MICIKKLSKISIIVSLLFASTHGAYAMDEEERNGSCSRFLQFSEEDEKKLDTVINVLGQHHALNKEVLQGIMGHLHPGVISVLFGEYIEKTNTKQKINLSEFYKKLEQEGNSDEFRRKFEEKLEPHKVFEKIKQAIENTDSELTDLKSNNPVVFNKVIETFGADGKKWSKQ